MLSHPERDSQTRGEHWVLSKTICKCHLTRLATRPSYINDTDLVATEFNQFFTSVRQKAVDAVSKLLRNVKSDSTTRAISSAPCTASQPFTFSPVSSCRIRKFISTRPSNKAPGPSETSMQGMKDWLAHILPVLTDIISRSLISSAYPAWKYTEVIPLPQQGDLELQPRTKLLRHFHAIFNFTPQNLRVQKEQIRPPPHSWCNVVLA